MKIKGPQTNHHIEVIPQDLNNLGFAILPMSMLYNTPEDAERDRIKQLEEIVNKIQHISGVHRAKIKFDQEYICSYCKRTWTEDGLYNNCCNGDEQEEDERQKQKV